MEHIKTQDQLLAFLKNLHIASLATIQPGNLAHAATIYYHVDKECNFYFLTKDGTLKFTNLRDNHSVALVISDGEALQTVQVEGTAIEVDYAHEYRDTVTEFITELEKSGKHWGEIPLTHLQKGYFSLVKITPIWIRWSDYTDWKNIVQFERDFTVHPK